MKKQGGSQMQNLLTKEILSEIRKEKLKEMEFELSGETSGSFVECPSCHYVGKNKRFTGKIFENADGRSFKCFACGLWRKFG